MVLYVLFLFIKEWFLQGILIKIWVPHLAITSAVQVWIAGSSEKLIWFGNVTLTGDQAGFLKGVI